MSEPDLLPADWSARYAAWLPEALPRLEAGESRAAMASYPFPVFDDAPLTPLRGPLNQARVALVSSGGLSLPGQAPFDTRAPEGDPTYRVVPGLAPLADWRIDHGHYDPASAEADYNTVFPIDVLRDLAGEGFVGSAAARHVSLLGYQTDAARLRRSTARPLAAQFREDGVDAVLVVPV
jgi:D-proline reductase (dithiol) PrdB